MSVQILNPTKYPVNQMGLSKFHSPGSPLSAAITSCSSDLFVVSGDLKKTGGEMEVVLQFAPTSGGVLFQAGACFSKEFWSVMATFSYFVTNLRTF